MSNHPGEGGQEPAAPAALETRQPGGPWKVMAAAGAVLVLVAITAHATARDHPARPSVRVVEDPVCDLQEGGLLLPPGHPPIWTSPRLPPGHPPIGFEPGRPSLHRLPAGHPPIGPDMGKGSEFPPGFLFDI